MNLIKIKVKGIKGFKNNMFDLDFIAEKRVSKEEVEDNEVFHLISSIYKFNSVALIGINATGKTTTLNIISFILNKFLKNESLSPNDKIVDYFDDQLSFECYFFDKSESSVYKLESTIAKIINKEIVSKSLEYTEEKLYGKKVNNSVSKKKFFEFNGDNHLVTRSELENEFLKPDDSIFPSVLKKNLTQVGVVKDLSQNVNFNFLSIYFDDMPLSFVNYLDPSIESLKVVNNDSNHEDVIFEIKFKNGTEYRIKHLELQKFLSSGTIKGLNVLMNVLITMSFGGYLIIDEIENHLNKSIVINIINLFSKKNNTKGATLVFSTHYSEILDSINRTDSINILEKKNDITIKKLSLAAEKYDRPDRKISDLLLSGIVSSTPSYKRYMNVVSDLKKYQFEKKDFDKDD